MLVSPPHTLKPVSLNISANTADFPYFLLIITNNKNLSIKNKKLKMKINGKDYRTVWMEDGVLKLIDQPKIPHSFEIVDIKDYKEAANAIRTMVTRGAPAIGATACYGMALAALAGNDLDKAAKTLAASRPTAYDLFDAISYFQKNYKKEENNAVEVADAYADLGAERCRKIGEIGAKLIKDGDRILTHCNAGALATVDYGTALAPIRFAHYAGRNVFVWVDETRPRCQGARLTAWEMVQEGIDHALIADNAAGHYMRKGEVDMCIVGADRVASNGDIANKIGTYEKAVVAKENGIPFYVAAPVSTFDFSIGTGDDIPIEERGDDEVKFVFGFDESNNTMKKIRITSPEVKARNPAFDVTPAEYITGIITELGILKPEEVKRLAFEE